MSGREQRPRMNLWRQQGRLGHARRSGGEVRELLAAASQPPEVDLYPRSDGPGSSHDLPQFAALTAHLPERAIDLHDSDWAWSRRCPRTPSACLDFEPVRYRAVPAADPAAFEYWAPSFHDAPVAVRDVIAEPRLFVHNVLAHFGLKGVRIEMDPVEPAYKDAGLGGSDLAHAAAILLASALSGADLSLPQIYFAGIHLENWFGVREGASGAVAFGMSLTGGQEALSAFQGGFFDNVYLPYQCGAYAVASRELVDEDGARALEPHFVMVNVGTSRTASGNSADVNRDLMHAWRTTDGAALHRDGIRVSYESAEAIRRRDVSAYADAVRRFREIRATMSEGYLRGQDELASLCEDVGAEYFPVGAGGGTCLVVSPDAAAITAVRERIDTTEERARGRISIPFRVARQGLVLRGFDELGLAVPAPPAPPP